MPESERKTILVVCNEPGVNDDVVMPLQAVGYRVLDAADGGQALAVLADTPVDLVVVDLAATGMGGHPLIAAIRNHEGTPADLPIIGLSAAGGPAGAIAGWRLGADDCLPMPVDPALMQAVIAARLAAAERATTRRRAEVESLRLEILELLPHELLTPLTQILGWSALGGRAARNCDCGMNDNGGQTVTHAFSEIDQGARALQHLVEGTIELIRIHGCPVVEKRSTEIAGLIMGAAQTARSYAADTGVRILTAVPDDLPTAETDAHLLSSTLFALLIEAPKGLLRGGSVTVVAMATRRDVVIRVERRDGASRTGRRAEAFLGVGFALAEAAAKALGGRFTLTGTPDGDVSTFEIPQHQDERYLTAVGH